MSPIVIDGVADFQLSAESAESAEVGVPGLVQAGIARTIKNSA